MAVQVVKVVVPAVNYGRAILTVRNLYNCIPISSVVPPGGVYVSYRFHGSPASRCIYIYIYIYYIYILYIYYTHTHIYIYI